MEAAAATIQAMVAAEEMAEEVVVVMAVVADQPAHVFYGGRGPYYVSGLIIVLFIIYGYLQHRTKAMKNQTSKT